MHEAALRRREAASLATPAAQRRAVMPKRGRRPVLPAVLLMCAALGAVLHGLSPLLQTSLNGLVVGVVLALGALGLSLIHSCNRVLNFAHGDMLTVGAYAALTFQALTGLSTPVSLAAAVMCGAAVGLITEPILWSPLRKVRATTFELLMTSIGLAFALRYGMQFLFGTDQHRLRGDVTATISLPFELRLATDAFWAVCVAFIAIGLTFACLRLTSLGKDTRAFADDEVLATVAGVSALRTRYLVWGLAGALAALAGALYGWSIGQVRTDMGFDLLLPIFAGAVVGGMRDPRGAVLGAILVAVAQEWSTLFVPPGWKLAVGFAVLVAVLLFRPSGLLSIGSERR